MGYIKIPVRVATLGDFTPTGAATIQGVALVNGDRVLIGFGASNPVASQYGGVWLVNTGGAWTRALDALTWDLLLPGTIVAAREGDYHGQLFVHTTDPGNWNSGSLGTTVQIWNTDVDSDSAETVSNQATLQALDASALVEGTSRYVLTYRDRFDLDKTTVRTAVPNVVVAASGGSGWWWVRRITPDPTWSAQLAWTINSSSGNDENLGNGSFPLKTRAEFFRRMKNATLSSTLTVTIAGSLDPSDTYTANVNTTFVAQLAWVGVPVLLFTGTVSDYVARNGSTSQPTQMGIAGIPSSWTASGLVDKVIEWTDGAGAFIRSVVVADLGALLNGHPTAWLSPPINQNSSAGQVFTIGQTIKVYDMPSVNEHVHDTTIENFSYLRASRWTLKSGLAILTNCLGICTVYGGTSSWSNCNTFPGPDDGNHNITGLTGTASILGGKHSLIGSMDFRVGGPVTVETVRPELAGTCETHITSGISGDLEIYNVSPNRPPIFFGTLNGGRLVCSGFVYGTSQTVTDAIQVQGRSQRVSLAHTPVITGAPNITLSFAGVTVPASILNTQSIEDNFDNVLIGPYGRLPSASVANNATLAALDGRLLGEGTSRFVLTYRDWFDLDKTTVRTAVADQVIAATNVSGAWWVRRRLPDPSWILQTAWTVDPVSGNDEGLGDSGHPLKTLSEYHLRLWGAQLAADHTVTINSSLNAGDSLQPFFVTNENGLNFTRYPHYVGVQRVVFTGTIDALGVVLRSGSTSQPTNITVTGLPSTWTAGDGVTSFVGLMVRRTSDGSAARVVKDLGGKTAWISQPIVPTTSTQATWAGGDAITVYDVPSLGQEVSPHAGISKYTDLKVTGRWILQTGTLDMRNCAGDCLIQAGTFCYNENGLSGLVSGASFLVSGGIGSIAGGYHRFDCRSGEIGFNITPTIKRILCEGSGIVTCQTGTGPQGTSDFEICQDAGSTSPPLQLGGVCGGRIAVLGFCYGVLLNTNALVQFVAIDSSVTFTNNPTCTGTLATQIVYSVAGLTDVTTALSTRQSNDSHGNRVIGTAGSSPGLLANGATALALGSTGPAGLPNQPVRFATWPDGVGGFITVPSWT